MAAKLHRPLSTVIPWKPPGAPASPPTRPLLDRLDRLDRLDDLCRRPFSPGLPVLVLAICPACLVFSHMRARRLSVCPSFLTAQRATLTPACSSCSSCPCDELWTAQAVLRRKPRRGPEHEPGCCRSLVVQRRASADRPALPHSQIAGPNPNPNPSPSRWPPTCLGLVPRLSPAASTTITCPRSLRPLRKGEQACPGSC